MTLLLYVTVSFETTRSTRKPEQDALKLEFNSFYFVLTVKTIKQHETARSIVVLPCRIIADQDVKQFSASSSALPRVKTTSAMSCNSYTMLRSTILLIQNNISTIVIVVHLQIHLNPPLLPTHSLLHLPPQLSFVRGLCGWNVQDIFSVLLV